MMAVWEVIGFDILAWSSFFIFINYLKQAKYLWKKIVLLAVPYMCTDVFFATHIPQSYENVCLVILLIYFFINNLTVFKSLEINCYNAIYISIWSISLCSLLYEMFIVLRIRANAVDKSWYFILWMVIAIIYLILIFFISKWLSADGTVEVELGHLVSVIVLWIIFIYEELYFLSLRTVLEENGWEVHIVIQIFCLIVLYLQNEILKKNRISHELEIMKLLLHNQKEQYHLSKEIITIMNQKSHDLKYQIQALKNMHGTECEDYIRTMEENIKMYESIVQTGNEVLDILLSEKCRLAQKKEITISCVADGKLLEFMEETDVYTLFGNALDNAMDEVVKFEKTGLRQIDVSVFFHHGMTVINIKNPLAEPLLYQNGLPVTTKGNSMEHGYGLKSIRYIAKKYEGYVNIKEEDGCFSLAVLFPVKSPF